MTNEEIKHQAPTFIGLYILQQSRRIMNNFIHAIDGFRNNRVYYTDTDSLYIEQKYINMLKEAGCYGDELMKGKSDYGEG